MISGGGRGGRGGDCPLPPKSPPPLSTLSLRACLSARHGEKNLNRTILLTNI